jgi:hypothetical protein
VDWLIEKNRAGYKMVNSVKRLNGMREFLRGQAGAVELPGRAELPDHPRGWHAGAVLPAVFGDL